MMVIKEMSIRYRLTEVKDNISNKPKRGYYAQVVTKGTIDTETLCQHIASSCSLTTADMAAAIIALSQNITNYLLEGYNVNINGIGTFSLSAESEVVENEKDLKAHSVRVKNVNFRSAVSLKKAMTKSKFVKVR
ncbi:MAG: HU family DNA-binding protein [Bacteroidaceae bacterium]|jgi:predicted histone-like DNA-binding protein|nr:HU family DNA-binding protein [Bacteroidaceae bacterium]